MARRNALLGIANSLIESFNSRNNDVNGYWAIGHLKSFSINSGLDPLLFTLLTERPSPGSLLLEQIQNNYSQKLLVLLKSQKIPLHWVNHATITIQFNGIEPSQLEIYRYSCGDFYRCRCQIIDDRNKIYTAEKYGFCHPHSSENEFRRAQ